MGCCISKCRPHKHNSLEPKLPIPQYSISNQISASPSSPTSSLSSFTCNSTLTSTSSLSSTASSSALVSKDSSFSNDFLRFCYQQNPHIRRIHSPKQASLSLDHSTNINIHPSSPIHKRLRTNSPPNLKRPKSFRKEPGRPNSSSLYHLPTRTLRSPSRSPAFINDSSVSRPTIRPKPNAISPLIRKYNVKGAASLNNTSRRHPSSLRQGRSSSCRIGSKIDKAPVNEVVTSFNHGVVSTFMEEDINNPLISLDCFIFL